jgi:hypothetical protein
VRRGEEQQGQQGAALNHFIYKQKFVVGMSAIPNGSQAV